jgi:carbon-monoxide dehydrogenase large subunit
MGAYLSTFSTSVPTYLYGTLLAGQYTTPLIYVEREGVGDATRRRSTPIAALAVRRRPSSSSASSSKAAAELKMDRPSCRRKNFIPADEVPVPDAGGAEVRFG